MALLRGNRRWLTAGAVVLVTLVAQVAGQSPVSAAPSGDIRPAGPNAIPGSYIVVLKDSAALHGTGVDAAVTGLTRSYGGTVGHRFRHALAGFEVALSEAAARRLAADPAVSYVEQNATVSLKG